MSNNVFLVLTCTYQFEQVLIDRYMKVIVNQSQRNNLIYSVLELLMFVLLYVAERFSVSVTVLLFFIFQWNDEMIDVIDFFLLTLIFRYKSVNALSKFKVYMILLPNHCTRR